MRIVLLIPSIDPRDGGTVEFVRSFVKNGQGLGAVVTLDPESDARDIGRGWKHVALGRGVTSYGYSRALKEFLERADGEYDLVVVNGLWRYPSLAARQTLKKTPYVVIPHGMLDPWFNTEARVKVAKKALFWHAVERHNLACARAVLYTTEEERRGARSSFSGYPQEVREEIFPLGASDPGVDDSVRTEDSTPYLLFLARVHPKKGVDILLRAYAAGGDQTRVFRLVIAGPGTPAYINEMKTLAGQLGIGERVHWAGPVYGDAKWPLLRGASGLVLASHQENFGFSVVEALACGVPVVTTRKVNIWGDVVAAGAGFAGEDNVDSFQTELLKFCSLLPEQRRAMGALGRRLFLNQFEAAVATRCQLAILRRIAFGEEGVAARGKADAVDPVEADRV